MYSLLETTKRRLQKIPQIPSVWEGDRRALTGVNANLEPDVDANGECIIWVDGSEGFVRAMDVVSPEMGLEALVRTLLRAIENPHSPAHPARPQKIVVRDREIQFFLRGVLQNLDIAIDYEPRLPLIDELFRGLETVERQQSSSIPTEYERMLEDVAYQIWNTSPWELITDRDILAIKIDRWHVETIYACIMGMFGREYGIVMYRSLDSLKYFRSVVLNQESLEHLEQAFLAQDCWFLNFEPKDDSDLEEYEEEFDLSEFDISEIRPLFGSIHPYEGMRPLQEEEEALAVYVALKALDKFVGKHSNKLEQEEIEEISDRYKIPIPKGDRDKQSISVQVSTIPLLAQELQSMAEMSEDRDLVRKPGNNLPIKDDLIPDGSYVSLGMIPWDIVKQLQKDRQVNLRSLELSELSEGMPAILIQTSRPKAIHLIDKLGEAGGIDAICFNRGEDRFSETIYDLGILQTGNGELYIFGEYVKDDPKHIKARKQWNQRCHKNNGSCGVIIAMGATGVSRGHPRPKDMMALFAAKALDPKDLGLGVLQLMPQFDLEFE
jgi:hypothetical protein